VARARQRWMREQGMFDPARLALRHMAHAPLAAGATAMQPHHLGVGTGLIDERQETITFVAALRWHGMRASQTIDGSMTGTKFLAMSNGISLRPSNARISSWIDNLPAHKAAGVGEAIEARGATVRYLPKYSPDLNPIEMPFSKLKAHLRKAAERTIPRLRGRIGRFARTLTAREASNYFRHAGYA
jgi:transposase